jgi:glycosyltransferase involved in cell wall biosynthesis
MVYSTTYPYLRRKNAFSGADQMGSAMVHTELLRSVLKFNVVESVRLIRDSPGEDEGRALAELRQEIGDDRVHVISALEYPRVASQQETIFVVKAPFSIPLVQARQALGGTLGPTCSLVHAVNWPNLMAAHLALLCTQEHMDTLVVPSAAAKQALLAIMNQTAEVIRKRFNMPRIDARIRLEHIPFGIDPEPLASVDKASARRVLDLPADAVCLLYFGRLSPEYKADLEPLLRVVAQLRQQSRNLRLILAGHDATDRYHKTLDDLTCQLGLSAAVTVVKNVSPLVKPLLYSAADIFVSPVDNIQESYGISLLEAMSAGLPVVASDWSGYREIVEHGKSGFLVPTYWSPSNDHLASWFAPLGAGLQLESFLAERTVVDPAALREMLYLLIVNPELRKTMGERGIETVRQKFSWKNACLKFKDLWESQLDSWRAAKRRQQTGGYFQYGEIFSQYASLALNAGVMVERTEYGEQLMREQAGNRLAVPRDIGEARIRQVLQMSAAPISVSDVVRQTDDEDIGSVCWLIKKCALRIAGCENGKRQRALG